MQGVPLARLAALCLTAPSSLALVAGATGCGGSEDGAVTYQKDISTLLTDCTLCHRPGAPVGPGTRNGPDVLNPYSPPDGLSVAPSYWKVDNPQVFLPIPERDVTPGNPDQSFLMLKISDPALGLLPEHTGSHMPYPIKPITADELKAIEQWVSDGAQDDDFYRGQVQRIFLGTSIYDSKCVLCHYHGTPHPPDLTDLFGPDGVVGIPSLFRKDMLRVAPGDPDASLLVQRVRASAGDNLPSSEFGAPMPRPTPSLDEAQQARVREWIAQGARP